MKALSRVALLVGILASANNQTVAQAFAFDIPLRISAEKGVVLPQPWIVTTGVPFENGQLFEKDFPHLRVVTTSGKSVPAQFETRGRYPSTKSVRWLGVYWQLDSMEQGYRLILSKDKTVAAASQRPVRVKEDVDAITIATGDFKTRIPRTGGMIAGAWLKEDLVLEQDKDENWLTTLQGAKHRQAGLKAVVERSGPLLANSGGPCVRGFGAGLSKRGLMV